MNAPHLKLFVLAIALSVLCTAVNACQSCLVDLASGGILRSTNDAEHRTKRHVKTALHSSVLPIGLSSKRAVGPIFNHMNQAGLDHSAIGFLAVRKFITLHQSKSTLTTAKNMQEEETTSMARLRMKLKTTLNIQKNPDQAENEADAEEDNSKTEEEEPEVMSQSMIMAIGFYKQFISPLLPPACRFLPTCSQYGVQAIKEFGPSKGVILTAWRLARCSPFGGRGEFQNEYTMHHLQHK